jgi:hypothetical protein
MIQVGTSVGAVALRTYAVQAMVGDDFMTFPVRYFVARLAADPSEPFRFVFREVSRLATVRYVVIDMPRDGEAHAVGVLACGRRDNPDDVLAGINAVLKSA